MDSVTVSPKYQVVIPQKIRKQLALKPGQKLRPTTYDNQVVLILFRPVKNARGSLKGIDTTIQREEDERV
jgi:AbrB family looped-hinge helix DNA binding protein